MENVCYSARHVNSHLAVPKVSAYTHMLVNQRELWIERSGAQYAQSHTPNQGLWRNTVWENEPFNVFAATNTLSILILWINICGSFVNKAGTKKKWREKQRKCYMNATDVINGIWQNEVWHCMFKPFTSSISGGPAYVQQIILVLQSTGLISRIVSLWKRNCKKHETKLITSRLK